MKITQREKLLIIVLLAVFLLWLDYTYVISGQLKQLEVAKNDLISYEQKYEDLKNAPQLIKDSDAKLMALNNQIIDMIEEQFMTTEQEELILLLTDLSSDASIEFTHITFESPKLVIPEDPSLSQQTIKIEYSGPYEAFKAFLGKVWNFQKDIVISEFVMGGVNNNVMTGSVSLDLFTLELPNGIDFQDNIYQFLIDDSFFKVNPFITSQGATDFRVNYAFIGGKEGSQISYIPFTDIKGHWAEKEINYFGEQGYIKRVQSEAFGPDTPISRGEFIIMIDSIYQWPMPSKPADLTVYSDYGNLGSYENAISKAVVKGLLGGYVVGFEDNTLRPRDPITYSDVEYIMQRIKNDLTFTWDLVGEKLLHDKSVQSIGMIDKSAQMTKAEAVFLMTHFK